MNFVFLNGSKIWNKSYGNNAKNESDYLKFENSFNRKSAPTDEVSSSRYGIKVAHERYHHHYQHHVFLRQLIFHLYDTQDT